MNPYGKRIITAVFGVGALFGVLLGVGVVLSTRTDGNIRVLTGEVNSVNQDGWAIGFDEDDGDPAEGYIVAGARWQRAGAGFRSGPDPDTGAPTCLEPLTAGQRVRLGVIEAKSDGFSAPVVAWLECLTPPTQRFAAAGQ